MTSKLHTPAGGIPTVYGMINNAIEDIRKNPRPLMWSDIPGGWNCIEMISKCYKLTPLDRGMLQLFRTVFIDQEIPTTQQWRVLHARFLGDMCQVGIEARRHIHEYFNKSMEKIKEKGEEEMLIDFLLPGKINAGIAKIITVHKRLGRGTSAVVYEVSIDGETEKQAVKIIPINKSNGDQLKQMNREIYLHGRLFRTRYLIKYKKIWIQDFMTLPPQIKDSVEIMLHEDEDKKYNAKGSPGVSMDKKCLMIQMDAHKGMSYPHSYHIA